jgi:hypothetical protein
VRFEGECWGGERERERGESLVFLQCVQCFLYMFIVITRGEVHLLKVFASFID